MFYGEKSFTVKTNSGAVIYYAAVYIFLAGTNTLATLYSSVSGGTKSNPLMTDENGVASCFLADGFYDAHVVHQSVDFSEGWERNYQISTASDTIQEISASMVLTEGGYFGCDATAGAIVFTMPPIADISETELFGFKKIATDVSANTVSMISADGATFDSSPELTMSGEGFWWAARSGVWTKIFAI
ncbi:MAG: hypothetical protein ABIH23_20280 [bacterium]